MADPIDLHVDPEALGAIKDRLEQTFMTFMDAIGAGAPDRGFDVTGSDDLTGRLDEFFIEANRGATKFTGEITDMMKRVKAAVDAYQAMEDDLSRVADEGTQALGGAP